MEVEPITTQTKVCDLANAIRSLYFREQSGDLGIKHK